MYQTGTSVDTIGAGSAPRPVVTSGGSPVHSYTPKSSPIGSTDGGKISTVKELHGNGGISGVSDNRETTNTDGIGGIYGVHDGVRGNGSAKDNFGKMSEKPEVYGITGSTPVTKEQSGKTDVEAGFTGNGDSGRPQGYRPVGESPGAGGSSVGVYDEPRETVGGHGGIEPRPYGTDEASRGSNSFPGGTDGLNEKPEGSGVGGKIDGTRGVAVTDSVITGSTKGYPEVYGKPDENGGSLDTVGIAGRPTVGPATGTRPVGVTGETSRGVSANNGIGFDRQPSETGDKKITYETGGRGDSEEATDGHKKPVGPTVTNGVGGHVKSGRLGGDTRESGIAAPGGSSGTFSYNVPGEGKLNVDKSSSVGVTTGTRGHRGGIPPLGIYPESGDSDQTGSSSFQDVEGSDGLPTIPAYGKPSSVVNGIHATSSKPVNISPFGSTPRYNLGDDISHSSSFPGYGTRQSGLTTKGDQTFDPTATQIPYPFDHGTSGLIPPKTDQEEFGGRPPITYNSHGSNVHNTYLNGRNDKVYSPGLDSGTSTAEKVFHPRPAYPPVQYTFSSNQHQRSQGSRGSFGGSRSTPRTWYPSVPASVPSSQASSQSCTIVPGKLKFPDNLKPLGVSQESHQTVEDKMVGKYTLTFPLGYVMEITYSAYQDPQLASQYLPRENQKIDCK